MDYDRVRLRMWVMMHCRGTNKQKRNCSKLWVTLCFSPILSSFKHILNFALVNDEAAG